MGLDVGSKDDFNALYAPVSAPAPQPKQEKPVQSQSAPQTQPSATETTTPTKTEQQPVSTHQKEEKPSWNPSLQDKIRMQYELQFGKDEAIADGMDENGDTKFKFRHTPGLMEFNERSRKRVEQARRVAERNTPEGRKKLKAAKIQAQLAGTSTSLMGLTPGTTPGMQPLYQEDGQQEQREPLLSGQGPIPHGVKIVNGECKTEWLLPDGSLTTNIADADAAEYGARRVRLMNQFVGRMKENGLDPSNQEDVQRQAQLDYETPIRNAVATAVQADDERSDKEKEAYMSNPLNMVGGVNAALGHAATRKQAGIGDLSRIAEEAYEALPSSYRRDLIASYTDYFTKHPEDTNGKTIDQAAKDAAKSVVYRQVHEEYVKRNGPQSKNEFFVRKMLELNPASVALSGTINPYGQAYAELDAMERYGAEHRGLDIAGMIAGMAIDPTTYLGGWAGKTAFNYATRGVGKIMAKRALGDVAGRYAATTLAGRIIGGMAAGGANFGTFEAVKDAERQLYQGGYLNPETGEGFSFGSVLNSGVHGIGMGAATGVVSPLIGNVADKAVKATTSTAGKVAMRGTEVLASTLAEGTVFSIPEWISGDQDAFDVWTDNMAMMAGFRLSHAIKTAPAMIRSLRPVKPTGDRPLSREERIHNNKSFAESLRERLDQSPSDIAMSKEEREELKRKGYGELSNLFAYDPEHKSRKAAAHEADGDYIGTTGLSRAVDYESTLDETGNPTFDGYAEMERLMEDESVSEATRARAYYILTGRNLPPSTVTGWSREDNEDGTITISSHSQHGSIVTSRTFSNDKEATREIERINRQTELNTIDIGEQYRNVEAQQRVMAAAINEISSGADPQTVYNIYEAVRRGDKNVTEDQRIMADLIDEAIERNTDAGAEVSPAGIRERISQETGVDIDKAIRKEPGKRTEAEKDAVNRYVRELFPEQEAYEPTPEEAEADRIYEDSRLLYGRFEQGDPEAQAEIDAISLRMTEAHQLCEDAFGDQAEVYMAEIKENPWGIVNDPNLTPDQKNAVLYYINAKASLDGVLDASNEAAADKRQKVQDEVAHRTHKEQGVIVPATMKADDRPVYIIKGAVAMFPDGSGVDVRNSSNDVIILDESGEYKFTSPDQILSIGEAIDPQIELKSAYDNIDREQEAILSAATEGVPENDEIVLNSGENRGKFAGTDYENGYKFGIEDAKGLKDEELSYQIERLRNHRHLLNKYRQGILNAYENELQQRRAAEHITDDNKGVLKNTESVPNIGESTEIPTENRESGTESVPNSLNPVGKAQETLEDDGFIPIDTGLVPNFDEAMAELAVGTAEAEEAPTSSDPELSAISQIPTNEKGEPIFEAVEKELAWDGLVEAAGSDKDAAEIAEAQIAQTNEELEALKKKPPTMKAPKLKGTPMAMANAKKDARAKYEQELADYNRRLADTQEKANAWTSILGVHRDRTSELRRQQEEERRQRDAELHNQAVTQFEEGMRQKAERDAEQAAIGTHAVNPKIKEKWDASPKVDGHPDVITLPDGSTLTGHYVMTEAGAASASHDIHNAFEPTEGFPIDKNGQSVNDRDYKRDRDAQQIVHNMADAYDSRAMQTPVIVSKDGIVLSGNNRTMSGDMAATQGTDDAYLEYLSKYGRKYGFTSEQVQGMKHPRVVFVPDEDLPYDANTFSRFNAQEMKSQSKPEASIKLGKIVNDATFNRIVADLNKYDRLSDFYANQEAAARTLGELVAAGAINDKQLPELRTGTALSAAGKELIENTLIGKVFQTSPDAVPQIISMPTLRESIVMSLSEIASNHTLAKKGYDLSKELANAVDLVYRAKTTQPKIYKEGMPVSPFGRMQGLFDDNRVTDAATLLLADLLNSAKPSDVRKVLALYNAKAQKGASGQYYISEAGDMMPPMSKNEVLTLVNELFSNGTAREKQELVDAAIADRKQRASAEPAERRGGEAVEQASDAGGRGEGSEEQAGGNTERTFSLEDKGRSLDREEAESLLQALKEGAEVAEEIPLTIENWDKLFGESAEISTPLEKVSMGEHQYAKLSRLGRSGKLGMVKPTLERPDIVISERSTANSGSETSRPSSHIYVKTFVNENGDRIYHFTSVTVDRDGKEVSISNQEKRPNRIINLLQNGRLIWTNPEKFEKEAISASDTQKEDAVLPMDSQSATQTAFTDSLGFNSKTSGGKDNTLLSDKQGKGGESSEEKPIAGLEGYTHQEVKDIVRREVEQIFSDADIDAEIVDMEIHGSRTRGDARPDSDLDIVLEYKGDMKEYAMFNAINDTPIEIEGIQVDVNPIRAEETGTLSDYMKKSRSYDEEKLREAAGSAPSLGERIAEAEKDVNLSPTEAQKKAGNYRKGHVQVGTFDVTIENPKGSKRSGTDANGKKWETTMTHAYGYILGTESVDGDHIDVFLSSDIDDWNGRKVFVVDQYSPDDTFDEHKVMLGFNDRDEAFSAYLSNYEDGWEKGRRLDCTEVNLDDFEKWIDSSKRKTKAFADYKSVKAITEDVDQTRTNINKEGIVTDGDGQPLTLYHGTPNKEVTSVTMLEPGHKRMGEEAPARFNGDGVSFAPEMSVAQEYAAEAGHGKGRIFPANIRLTNPYYTLGIANFTPEEAAEFTAGLKAKGHDGIINYSSASMREVGALPAEVIVFDKSAIIPIEDKNLDGFGYTITPTQYQGKKKKEPTPVWVVKFDRDLSYEEKRALVAYMKEPLAEGKKTSRGWLDKESGHFYMRSEEAAKGLAAMLDNAETIADAQPLSAEDYKEAIAPAAKEGGAPAKAEDSKKVAAPTPMNRVDVDGLFNDLSTKGVTTLSDHSAPVKPESAPAKPEPKQKPRLVRDEEMRNLENELRDLLGIDDSEGDRGDLFRNPEDYTTAEKIKIISVGTTYAFKYFDQGIIEFPDFAALMVRSLGEKIRPWIKSFYNGAQSAPGYDRLPFTPADEVKAFDIMNFDKAEKDTDPMRTAQGVVAESRAEAAAEEARKEITEQRNQKRKERDEQTTADTEALGEKADTVAGKAESLAKTSEDERELNQVSDEIDETIDEINDQLALLGYYEADLDSPEHEVYGLRRSAEKKAVKDAVKLAKQLVNDLGIEIEKVAGKTTEQMQKSRGKNDTAVRANIAQVGGDITVNLPYPDGRNLHINIGLSPTHERGVEPNRGGGAWEGDNYEVDRIMFRFGDSHNHFLPTDVTYGKMLDEIQRAAKWGQPKKQEAPKAEQAWPDVKDTEAVSKWLYENSAAIWKGVDAITKDAKADTGLRNTFKASNDDSIKEADLSDYVERWLAERIKDMMELHPATVKAWYDYDQQGLILSTIAGRIEDALAKEAKNDRKDESHNGYKRGDEVLWDRYGNGKWEKVKIEDFDTDGSPIFESVKGIMSEKGNWSRVKPADGVFGEAKRVATKAQEDKKKKAETTSSPEDKPAEIKERVLEVLNGGKNKRDKKKQEVKSEQPVGDLFGGLFEKEPTNDKKETELRPRPGTGERERGHEPRQDEPVGTSQRNEDGGTDGRGMAGRGGGNTMPDTGRGSGVSAIPSEHAVTQSERKARKKSTPTPQERLPEAERKNTHNNRAERGMDYAPKGVDARIRANIKAIELAQELLESGRKATPEQMAVLRQFSGWGGLGKAFNDNGYSMQIKKLLGSAYEDAVKSRKSAYYTPSYIIDTMWDIARAMGFKGGNVLEGSAGIGNILGLMPQDMSERSNIHAVEYDSTTGGILSLLYPDAKVDIQGFEATKIPNGSVDLSITNVPFITGWNVADTSGDKDLSRKFRDIHDFCIAKNIRKLKPGGVGIFITSSGTLDNSDKLRAWITNEGASDVVGAFRMNNQTFGGTGATSDIIVVRKRINDQKSPHAIDVSEVTGARIAEYDTGEVKKEKGKAIPVVKTYPMRYNKYFFEHPENMAGEMMFNFEKGETFQPTSRALFPVKGKDQTAMLKEWAGQFSDMDFEVSPEDKPAYAPNYDSVGNEVKTGSMIVDSQGRLCTNMNGTAVPVMGSTPTGYSKMTPEQKAKVDAERVEKFNRSKIKGRTRQQCLKDYNELKKALADVLQYQTEKADNEGLEPLLKKLNQTFDRFVSMYGNLHKNTQLAWLRNDVDYPSILALESFEERPNAEGERIRTYGKTDIFSQRVVEKEVAPKPENVKDGIIASIYMNGRIDLPYISEALGRSPEEVKKEIISSGLGFENPNTTDLEVSYEYLSGNVREKLRQAQDNNEDGRYTPNIKALERVIPMNIPAHLIEFSLGSSWITPKLYEGFIKERTGVSVRLKNAGGTWFVGTPETGTNTELNRSQGIFSEMFKSTIFGHQLMEAAITNRSITVSRTYKHSDGSSETVTDKDATQACAAKIDEIRQDFKDWARQRMQQDPEMSDEIERIYNEKFNNYVARNIPEEFIPEHFGGAAHVVNGKPFKLRLHQAKAVIRGTMQSQLLAHEVGTGKTYTLISTAMEMRRLGTARKPMIVVQNATVGQFVESAKALYPNARILTIEEADRTSEGRKNFYAKIKYNDWDMIVVPQSVFERIPDSEERQIKFIQDKIEEKLKVLEDMKEEDPDGKSMIVRQAESELEKSREELNKITQELEEKRGKKKEKDEKREAQTKHNAEVRAMEMLDRETDDVENFDEMGIDAILVDEAHEYKHLGFSTAMQRGVKGVDPSYSKKAQGVYLKTLAVKERNNGRNVIFATGTPISNTAAEIWTFMRYLLDPDMMKEYGIYYFDDFVRNFGNLQQMLEFTTSGKFKENNRFAGYVNLPELVRIWSGAADTVLTREAGGVNDKIPKMEGDKAQDIYLPQTRALRSVMLFVKSELDRYEKMTGKEKKQNSHIPLVMYGLAKAAAVDARLVVAGAEDDPNSKTNEAVRQTLKSLKETESYKGTVAIFADNYQNKKSGFNLYEDIRQKLIDKGVPADQIVVMRSDMTVKKKLDIFDRVNRGDIRVIMGSTFTLGTGVNIQERLHTLIHVDAPNRPMDYTQRNGRILRQGNLHKEMGLPVRVLRFGVEDSLDVTAYQRLKTKGAIADSIMNGKELISNAMENRSMEEDEDVFGDITAQLSGSEYAMLKNQAEKQVRKYTSKLKQWEAQQTHIHNQLPRLRGQIKAAEQRIEEARKHLEVIGTGRDNKITIGSTTYPNIEAMADLFTEHNKRVKTAQDEVREGSGERTMTMNVNVGGIDFTINTKVNRKIANNGQLSFESERNMTYSCQALGMEDVPVSGSRLKAAIEDIVGNVMTGDLFRERIETANNSIERMSNEVAQLESQKGKPFEHVKELEEAEARLEEYTEKMKAELAEKEAKYADIDATVEAAEDVAFVEDEEEEETEETKKDKGRELSRLVSEGNSLDFLDAQGHRSAYRYAQFVPGGLTKYGTGYVREGVRPPMTAIDSETQDWRAPMVFNEWEQSVEGMRKDNGKADLVQGNGRTTGNVAYNPYFHIRVHPLNDQFSAAYDRPELVVVEGDYPKSELTSGYRAEGAKNAVGLTDWHAGSVNGQLSPGKKVQTVLSRYFKPRRIVPWSEVAERIMDHIAGEDVTFPLNVVPPRLRAELSKRGAKFHGISGSVSKDQRVHLGEVERELAAGNHDFGVEGGLSDSDIAEYNQRIDRLSSTDPNTMEGAVTLLSDKLNTPIRVISRKEAEAEGYRRKKGWYDRETGQITVVSDNHRNVGDIADTAVHEAVGHHGLRQLFGTEEKLNYFLDEAYNISNDRIKAEIDRRTEKMMDDEVDRLREKMRKEHEARGENPEEEYYSDMAKARIEAEKQREQIRRDATEEYAADLGMKIGEEGFERMDAEEQTFWGKLKVMLQKALDRLLSGLKLPKMRAWTDKEWSYVLWKSWRNLREGNHRSFFTEAEDIVRRENSNFGASESRLFRDGDLGLEEAITKMKADAATANGADFKAKQDAMRAIGGNLSKLRQAMARQREYDITTVKSMTDLSKILLDSGLLDDLSKYETKRILSAIKDAVGREDTSKQVQRLMDIMVDNQLRMGANYFGKLLSVKGSRIDARGIEIQGELDPDGQKIAQVVRKTMTLPKETKDANGILQPGCIAYQILEARNRMGSNDLAIAEEGALEYAGLQIAHQYAEEIRESKSEERDLTASIKEALEEYKQGNMTHDAYLQYKGATEDAIRQNKIERAEAYRSLSEQLGGVLGESVQRAKQWREAEKQRVEEIHHNANSDMKGRPTNEHHKADRLQKFVNNGILRFLFAPLGTFDQMLRMFGSKSVRGEGYLWNRYMRGWVDCTEKEYTGYQEALKTLDKKVSKVFGKDMKWGDLFAMERRMPKASVRFWDGGEMRDHELMQGNLLYIYMTDKMTDGRMKLRRMGITEDDVERIKDFVDPRFIQLADWMQEEYLTEKRNGYNEVHKRMFGTSMAAIENYFPLKILANARMEDVDVADDTGDNILPATSTGSIIKRKRNNLALDVTGADAFSVILDHIQQMERWAAFAEYNRDLNTLLSYKRFRNQVMNMTSAYGAGKTLWTNFRNVAAMAAGAYRPPIAPLDKAAVNVAKGVTAAKVSFRMFTALKQFLSMPAYVSDSNPIHLAANIANPYKAWKWSMENLPLFEKRWKSRMAGDPRLLKSDMDWKMWRSRIVEIAGRVGMSPNAFVDALTVSIGARSMYQTKLAKYKRQGYSPEQARKRARQDATILFNQTQQSSENAFLSTMQVDRSWLSVLFTVFRNSSMSYTRQLYDAMRNIGHRLRPGYKGMTEEFMAKQMRRDGIDPDKADRNAKQEYRRGIIRDLVRIGVFGYALQFAWNLGAYLPYLIFGKNADEKDKMWDDVLNHSMFGSVEGLTGGDVMSAAGEIWMNGEGNPEQLTKDMPLASDVVSILRKMDKEYVSAMNDVVNLLVQSGLGFNPQSLTDAAVAIIDYCGEDAQTSRECALLISRIINCPQSQIDKIYFDEIDATGEEASTMTPEEIAERYAEYKLHRNAALTGWAYDEEGRKKAMEKQRKKAEKAMKERMTARASNERTRELLESFDEVSEREKELNRLKKSDREAYRRGRKELREGTNMRRHNRVKRYDHDIKRLTEKWMNAKTTQEADSIAKVMLNARERMLIDVDSIEAQ